MASSHFFCPCIQLILDHSSVFQTPANFPISVVLSMLFENFTFTMLLFGAASVPFVRHEFFGGRNYILMTNYILRGKKHVAGTQ